MRNLLVAILSFCMWQNSQAQNDCDRLFYQYNPKYHSARTTQLVINEIQLNCVNGSFPNLSQDKGVESNKSNNNLSGSVLRTKQAYDQYQTLVWSHKSLNEIRTDDKTYRMAEAYLEGKHFQHEISVRNTRDNFRAGIEFVGNTASTAGKVFEKIPHTYTQAAGKFAGYLGKVSKGSERALDVISYVGDHYMDQQKGKDLNRLYQQRLQGQSEVLGDCLFKMGAGDCFNKLNSTDHSGLSSPSSDPIDIKVTDEVGTTMAHYGSDPGDFTNGEIETLNEQIKEDRELFIRTENETKRTMLNSISEMQDKILVQVGDQLNTFGSEINGRLDEVDVNISEMSQRQDKIYENTRKNSELIDRNYEEISALGDMMYANASEADKLVYRINCDEGKLPCPRRVAATMGAEGSADREEFRKNIKATKTAFEINKIESKANEIYQNLNTGLQFANALGLSPEISEGIGHAMHYGNSIKDVGLGFAKAFFTGGFDLGGLMQGLQGLTGLIGGPFKPQPDPTLVAIDSLASQMHRRFDVMQQSLDTIYVNQFRMAEKVIDQVQTNRDIMQYEFNGLSYDIAKISNRQNIMLSNLRTLLNQDFSNCRSVINVLPGLPLTHQDLDTYDDYSYIQTTIPGNILDNCMDGLTNRLNPSSGGLFEANYVPRLDQFSYEIELEEREYENYRKVVAFFNWYYGPINLDNLDRAVDMLHLPTTSVSESNDIYCDWYTDTTLDFPLSTDDVLGLNYLDPYAFKDFVEIYSVFYPYYEIDDLSPGYSPMDIISFIESSATQSGVNRSQGRNAFISNQIEALLSVQNIIRAQQSLMSGTLLIRPFYMILHQNQYSGNTVLFNGQNIPVQQLIIDILGNNSTISQNYMVYLLRKNFRLNEYVYKDSLNWVSGSPRNPNENALFSYGYDGLPLLNYEPNDSFSIRPNVLSNISVSSLRANSYIDSLTSLSSMTWDPSTNYDHSFYTLDRDIANPNPNLLQSAKIPFPESVFVENDKFQFRAGFYQAEISEDIVNHVFEDIIVGSEYTDSWQETLRRKYIWLENSEQ